MAKWTNDLVLDAALDFVINNTEKLVLCTAEPASYADATTDSPTGVALGETAMTPQEFTKADGDINGRKLTVAAQAGIQVDVGGTANHIALVDDTNSRLILVTTVSPVSLTLGGSAEVAAFDQEIADPA